MNENNVVNRKKQWVKDIISKNDLIQMFKRMGLYKGMIVYVQSSLEDISYVNGGSQTIIDALIETVGYEGTIVTSSFTPSVIDPACDTYRLFERDVFEEIRNTKPAFHKKKSMSESGAFSVQFMNNEGIYRSYHPTHSFLAWGKYAKLICDRHPLHFSLGMDSPLHKVVEMNGYILLLGTLFKDCDILKYASTLSMNSPIRIVSSPIEKKDKTEFIEMLEISDTFKGDKEIEDMLMERELIVKDYASNALCSFFKAKEASILARGYYNTYKD